MTKKKASVLRETYGCTTFFTTDSTQTTVGLKPDLCDHMPATNIRNGMT